MDDGYSDFFIDDFEFGNLNLEDTDREQLLKTEGSKFCCDKRFVLSEKELIQIIRTTVSETLEQIDTY